MKACHLEHRRNTVLVVAHNPNFPITPKTIIQNGDRTWEPCPAFGDPIQVVPHGQPAGHEYSHYREGSDSFPTVNPYGGEFREESIGDTICASIRLLITLFQRLTGCVLAY